MAAGASSVEYALRRLEAAMGRLETAIERRAEAERQAADLENELHRLGTDRSRLAQALDGAEARSARLEEVNREVSRRLVGAMESIRGVLQRHGG
jgi:hypothetical protein